MRAADYIGWFCTVTTVVGFVYLLLLFAGCASDPYPNDRSMSRMSVAQLTLELAKP